MPGYTLGYRSKRETLFKEVSLEFQRVIKDILFENFLKLENRNFLQKRGIIMAYSLPKVCHDRPNVQKCLSFLGKRFPWTNEQMYFGWAK